MRAGAVLGLILPGVAGADPARMTVLTLTDQPSWFGGLSAIDVSSDGTKALALSDRGRFIRLDLLRDAAGTLVDIAITDSRKLPLDRQSTSRYPAGDSEGLDWRPGVDAVISFEGGAQMPRLSTYGRLDRAPTRGDADDVLAALPENQGIEALARLADGTLVAIAEYADDTGLHVFQITPDGRWSENRDLQPAPGFRPTGADMGPDGALYILERRFTFPVLFTSRIRRVDMTTTPWTSAEVFRSDRGQFDNLEGLSLWQTPGGTMMATMVSDNNFLPVQSTQVVEVALTP